jgi:hypothetical protein
MANIDGMMRKIQGLLDSAESFQATGNAEAAATYRTKAEQLMRDYRIEEENLVREAVSSGLPIWRKVWIGAHFGNEWLHELVTLFSRIAKHCGVEHELIWDKSESGEPGWASDVIGYEIDIRLLEMIFVSTRLAFLARLEPTFDPALSTEENIYRLRGSGMDRQRVAEKVFGQKGHSEGIRVGSIYRAECERRGEVDAISGRGFNANLYRQAYAKQFVATISRRLRDARDAADSIGGALVLPQRVERINEALYERYPERRPWTAEKWAEYEKQQAEAEKDKSNKPAKVRKPSKAEQGRQYRANYSPAAIRARQAADEAARSVDLVRETTKANRAEGSNRTALEG